MTNEIVMDIETTNSFAEVGKYDPSLLNVSLVGVYFYATDTYESFLEPELPKLWRLLEGADRIIGYNLIGFDYKVLNRYYPGDLLKLPTLDVMYEIEHQIGFRVKIDDVAQATLGVGKSGNGLMAIEYFRRGELDKLREYCLMDVKVTKEVYEHGLKNNFVNYKDRLGNLKKAEVNFAVKEQAKQPLSLTLPL